MVDAIGAATLQAIATAGPDMQVCTNLCMIVLVVMSVIRMMMTTATVITR